MGAFSVSNDPRKWLFLHAALGGITESYPPVRPVFWLDPTDPILWNVNDAFLLGDRVLIYPILQEGARSRSITLPNGHWYYFWDDLLLEGDVTIDAPLEQIPVLVKAGAILPMSDSEAFSLLPKQSLKENHLTLHLYAPAENASAENASAENPSTQNRRTEETNGLTLYTDAGGGYKASRLDRFSMQRIAGGLDLDWESGGDFPFPYESIQVHIHGMAIQQAWVDGETVTVQGNWVNVRDRFSHLHIR